MNPAAHRLQWRAYEDANRRARIAYQTGPLAHADMCDELCSIDLDSPVASQLAVIRHRFQVAWPDLREAWHYLATEAAA